LAVLFVLELPKVKADVVVLDVESLDAFVLMLGASLLAAFDPKLNRAAGAVSAGFLSVEDPKLKLEVEFVVADLSEDSVVLEELPKQNPDEDEAAAAALPKLKVDFVTLPSELLLPDTDDESDAPKQPDPADTAGLKLKKPDELVSCASVLEVSFG